ncbi:hypothetical protein MP638_004389 [Amoeboaphelidium occidentale]|nr:hypothetical protein MP638_004389 [Amoeboaphelidium occidentale]
MKNIAIHLALTASLSAYGAMAACCFMGTPKFVSPFNFNYNLTLGSSEAPSKNNDYSVKFSFPSTYVVTNLPTSCQNQGNTITCTKNALVFSAFFQLNTPGNSNGEPEILSVSAFDESCEKQQYCPLVDQLLNKENGNGGTKPGMIDLGPLGMVAADTFWPVMITIIIVILGAAALAYTRNKKAPSSYSTNQAAVEASEMEMTKSKNKAGWFGEKKHDLETGHSEEFAQGKTASGMPRPSTAAVVKNSPASNRKTDNSDSAKRSPSVRQHKKKDSDSAVTTERTKSVKRSNKSSDRKARDSWAPKKATLFDKIETQQQMAQDGVEPTKKIETSTDDEKPIVTATTKKPAPANRRIVKKKTSDDSSTTSDSDSDDDDDDIDLSRVVKRVPAAKPSQKPKTRRSRKTSSSKNKK